MSQNRFSLKFRLPPFFALASSSSKQERKRRASSSEADREIAASEASSAAVAAAAAAEGRSAQKTDDSDDRSLCPLCKNPLATSGSASAAKKKQSGVCKCRKSLGRNFFRRDPRRHSHAGTSEVDSLRNKVGKPSSLDYFEDEADLFDAIVQCPDETTSDADIDAAASSSTSSTSNGRRPEVNQLQQQHRRPPRRPASCTFGKLDVVIDKDMASSTFVKANFLDPKQGKGENDPIRKPFICIFTPAPLSTHFTFVAVVSKPESTRVERRKISLFPPHHCYLSFPI